MNLFRLYLREVKYLNLYITSGLIVIFLSYSVYAVFDAETIARLGDEDRFFEWLTAISFLTASIIFCILSFRSPNIFYILMALIFFFGFGEEISWGQRIIGFRTPEAVDMHNVQGEFTIHNLQSFNTANMGGGSKSGFSRLLEINFLFKIFTVLISLALPFAVFHIKTVSRIAKRIKIPVPPASITFLFSANWIVFKILLDYLSLPGQIFQYYDTDTEIFEFVSAFIIFVVALYFYYARNEISPGEDVKEFLLANGEKEPLRETLILSWRYSPLRYLIKIRDFLILKLPFN